MCPPSLGISAPADVLVHRTSVGTGLIKVYCCLMNIHYDDVTMSAIASQITSLTIVYSIVYSDADQSKHQSSASLAFVWGIHRGPVNSPHKWPVTRKMLPFDDVIMWGPDGNNITSIGKWWPRSWTGFYIKIFFSYEWCRTHFRGSDVVQNVRRNSGCQFCLPACWTLRLLWWPLADAAMFQCSHYTCFEYRKFKSCSWYRRCKTNIDSDVDSVTA